jgi:hypothetical protein
MFVIISHLRKYKSNVLRFYFTAARIAIIKKMEKSLVGDVGKLDLWFMASKNVKWVSICGKPCGSQTVISNPTPGYKSKIIEIIFT